MGERTRLRIDAEITMFLAGPADERDLAGRWNHVGAEHDREVAANLASLATPRRDRMSESRT